MSSTSYSNPTNLVLQILPEERAGLMRINGKEAVQLAVMTFIPKLQPTYISCPLNYLQENASLPEMWIEANPSSKINLDYISNLETVIITEKKHGNEIKLNLPPDFGKRLLTYFKLDICHYPQSFAGFDCYAFVSMLANVKYCKANPRFEYEERMPTEGDFVALSQDNTTIESIKHWALYLGKGYYLSKFGMSGLGTQSLISVMDLEGMHKLYESKHVLIARPKHGAEPWNGFKNIVV